MPLFGFHVGGWMKEWNDICHGLLTCGCPFLLYLHAPQGICCMLLISFSELDRWPRRQQGRSGACGRPDGPCGSSSLSSSRAARAAPSDRPSPAAAQMIQAIMGVHALLVDCTHRSIISLVCGQTTAASKSMSRPRNYCVGMVCTVDCRLAKRTYGTGGCPMI